jgi:hypothetical protein
MRNSESKPEAFSGVFGFQILKTSSLDHCQHGRPTLLQRLVWARGIIKILALAEAVLLHAV